MTHTIQSHIPYWKLQVIKWTKLRENFFLYNVMKVRLSGSLGMESEQAIEALHPKMNRWSATFASVANDVLHLAAIAETQWLQSTPSLPEPRLANAPSVAEMHTIRENAQTHRSVRLH